MWNISSPIFIQERELNTRNLTPHSISIVRDSRGLHYQQSNNQQSHPQQYSNQTNTLRTIYQSTFLQFIWIFFWLLILLISFILSLCAIFIFLFLSPFTVFWNDLSKTTNFLVTTSQLPTWSAKNLVDSKSLLSL